MGTFAKPTLGALGAHTYSKGLPCATRCGSVLPRTHITAWGTCPDQDNYAERLREHLGRFRTVFPHCPSSTVVQGVQR